METKLANKIISREAWCADEGFDYDDVFEQIAQEDERADPRAFGKEHPANNRNADRHKRVGLRPMVMLG